MRRILTSFVLLAFLSVSVFVATGCGGTSNADIASENLSKAAEQFKIVRRIVGINGITDKVEFEVTGRCSVEGDGLGNLNALTIICKDPDGLRKHFIGQSDNMSFIVTQIDAKNVSEFRTKIILKPESLIPDFDLVTSGNSK